MLDEEPKMKPQGIVDHEFVLKNKQTPPICHDAVSYALSFFPELKSVPIRFYHKSALLPHQSRPTIRSIFTKAGKNRIYTVTVSGSTVEDLKPLIFDNLSFNEQVGMIAHELAHITQYQQYSTIQLIKTLLGYLNGAKRTVFEQNADKIVIQRGLGWELYDFANAREWAAIDNPVVAYLSGFHLTPEEIVQYMQNLKRSSKIDFLIDFTNSLN